MTESRSISVCASAMVFVYSSLLQSLALVYAVRKLAGSLVCPGEEICNRPRGGSGLGPGAVFSGARPAGSTEVGGGMSGKGRLVVVRGDGEGRAEYR